ncbi:uncharacterized protein GGS22DRAFT_199410 [Annulohypoxylon maeteangense]|uniref:uncharacterized protein n=1 Tax=Annulohypoxylon maeteangense TaxID=1927788 RepID=UPI0020080DE3|nr:uncharacterized protein GGS22DRAFT_199410 [Annulohypoxylon maeteangense]KAI0885992.1 hypothetical protein GGS22DRAFT_199410 [Annulohypoxylon maeteangense]
MDRSTIAGLLLSLNPTDVVDAQTAAVADDVATYFRQDKKLLYRGMAGIGRHGGALIFAQIDENRCPVRRIIVKYSIDATNDEDLINEAFWLEKLRGAEHIGQMIPLANANVNISGTGKRPTLALEYIENGTMSTFLERYGAENVWIPNRMLWSIFLCLVRQEIAMAWPPRGAPNAPLRREMVDFWEAPTALTQNSPHRRNLVIGNFDDTAEHSIVPRIHLIDFGRGKLEIDYETAQHFNTGYVGYMMSYITLCHIPDEEIDDETPWEWHYYDSTGVAKPFLTFTDSRVLNAPNIDPELATLIARCMSPDAQPRIGELLELCEQGAALSGEQMAVRADLDPEWSPKELDEGIRELIKQYILDAPSVDGRLPADRPLVGLDAIRPPLTRGIRHPLVRPKVEREPQNEPQNGPQDEPQAPRPSLFQGFQEQIEMIRMREAREAAAREEPPRSLFRGFRDWFFRSNEGPVIREDLDPIQEPDPVDDHDPMDVD